MLSNFYCQKDKSQNIYKIKCINNNQIFKDISFYIGLSQSSLKNTSHKFFFNYIFTIITEITEIEVSPCQSFFIFFNSIIVILLKFFNACKKKGQANKK